MPTRRAIVHPEDVFSFVRQRNMGSDRDGVGIEAEWLTYGPAGSRPRFEDLRSAGDGADLPFDGKITLEPGGQIELSTRPFETADRACDALEADALALSARLADRGVQMETCGFDPRREPVRTVSSPRYEAMESYFDRLGPQGRLMMSCTAALQINIDLGQDAQEADARWHVAHVVGPVLAAAFSNSSIVSGAPSGWRSARLANWFALDPSRTRPVGGGELCYAWALYALRAPVMFIRQRPDHCVPLHVRMSFEEWMRIGHDAGYPDHDDLECHLTTLFPPVRPRGWLELRMIDAIPLAYARAAVAVAHTVLVDREARATVLKAIDPRAIGYEDAYRLGLHHPAIGMAAEVCFAVTRDSLADRADTKSLDAVTLYADRFVSRRRTPADESLEDWISGRATSSVASGGKEIWT